MGIFVLAEGPASLEAAVLGNQSSASPNGAFTAHCVVLPTEYNDSVLKPPSATKNGANVGRSQRDEVLSM